ncbi:hypothetical protein C1J01_48405, partial [Nonomuraea aridisoli]
PTLTFTGRFAGRTAPPETAWRTGFASQAAGFDEPAGFGRAGGAFGEAGHRLDVIPVTALLGDERFRELAGVRPDALERVAEGDRAVFLPELSTPAYERPPEGCPDGMALMARHAVVPFLGRDAELDELRSWAAEPDPLSIAVVTGRGGTGKTRLAVRLCEELAEAGWDTGFLPLDAVYDLLSGSRAEQGAARPGAWQWRGSAEG